MAGTEAGREEPASFAEQKTEAIKWHGCHFIAAQGIEAEILLRSKR
jgi:hypothetical protein